MCKRLTKKNSNRILILRNKNNKYLSNFSVIYIYIYIYIFIYRYIYIYYIYIYIYIFIHIIILELSLISKKSARSPLASE